MTKPTKWVCAQRRLRSAWASAQSDQSSLCTQWVAKDPRFFMWTEKTPIRLGGCPGWSESSLGSHSFCLFCHVAAHLLLTNRLLSSTQMRNRAEFSLEVQQRDTLLHLGNDMIGTIVQCLWYTTQLYKVDKKAMIRNRCNRNSTSCPKHQTGKGHLQLRRH